MVRKGTRGMPRVPCASALTAKEYKSGMFNPVPAIRTEIGSIADLCEGDGAAIRSQSIEEPVMDVACQTSRSRTRWRGARTAIRRMNGDEELEKLLQGTKRGDKEACENFARRCKEEAYRIATGRVGDRLLRHLDIDDVVQSALRRVVSEVSDFEFQGAGAWRAWLRRIIDHTIVDADRRIHADFREPPGAVLPLDDHASGGSGAPAAVAAYDGPSPSAIASRKEQFEVLLAAMASLPEDYRKALQLRYLEGKSVAQVAERLGRTAKAVEDLLARARKAVEKATGTAIDA